MVKTVLVASGKGGTGKTTTTVMLGRALSKKHKVALLDLDMTGPNTAHILGLSQKEVDSQKTFDGDWFYPIKYSENLEIFSPSFLFPPNTAVAWSGDKRRELIHELIDKVKWNSPDILLCDSPPGTGDEIMAVLRYIPKVDGAVIVTNAMRVSLDDAQRLISLLTNRLYNVPVLGIIDNMSSIEFGDGTRSDLFDEGISVGDELGIEVLAKVPFKHDLSSQDFDGVAGIVAHRIGLNSKEVVQ
uniref:AAA+ ATPase domain-containing protein n=1 Tax=viral metagenome TaxID=1070528 RepID=A0A6M3JV23_9ZZZZ